MQAKAMLGCGNQSLRRVEIIPSGAFYQHQLRALTLLETLKEHSIRSLAATSHSVNPIGYISDGITSAIEVSETHFDVNCNSGARITVFSRTGYWLQVDPLTLADTEVLREMTPEAA